YGRLFHDRECRKSQRIWRRGLYGTSWKGTDRSIRGTRLYTFANTRMVIRHLLKPMGLWKALMLFAVLTATAQPFQFAHVTDTHVGGASGVEDLRRTI